MESFSSTISDSIQSLGQAFFVAYYLPAAIFILVHVYVLIPALTDKPPEPVSSAGTETSSGLLTSLLGDVDLASLIGFLLLPLLLGIVLRGLNSILVRAFEGKLPWLREGLLLPLTRRNRKRSRERYGTLIKLQQAYQPLRLEMLTGEPADANVEAKLNALKRQIHLEHNKIGQGNSAHRETEGGVTETDSEQADTRKKSPAQTPLPRDLRRVGPTLFGNIYALAEEYAYERYGVDSVLFWPHLRNLMTEADPGHSERLSQQRTFLDMTVNLAVIAGLLAVEAAVVMPVKQAYRDPWLLLVFIGGVALAVSFYYASVGAVRMMSELIKISFDFHRGLLLKKFNIIPPDSLALEQEVWVRLAAFIKRGDDFYFPADQAVKAKEESESSNASDG